MSLLLVAAVSRLRVKERFQGHLRGGVLGINLWPDMESTFQILVAEDNEDDIFILETALRRAGITNPTQICRNGKEMVDYLAGEGPFADRSKHPLPRLMFIDLKMPLMSGLEVLRWRQTNPRCAAIPAIVLTSSNNGDDLENAYKFGANAYLVKPVRLDDFEKVLVAANNFWQMCELPPSARS